MPAAYLLYALGVSLFLAAIVAGNNLVTCSGTIIAGRIVGKKSGILIAIAGYLIGIVVQGGMLHSGLFTLLPFYSSKMLLAGMIAAAVIFVASQLLKAPQSLSIVLVSALVGASLASGYGVNSVALAAIMAVWIIAPLISLLFAFILSRYEGKTKKGIWKTLGRGRTLLIVTSFLMAYTLGANTLGLLYSSTGYGSMLVLSLFAVAIIIGSFLFSGSIIRSLGEELMPIRYRNAVSMQAITAALVEAATVLSIPLSNTQVFTTSLLGSGLGYKMRIIEPRSLKIVVLTWVIGALACFGIGYMLVLTGL